MKKQVAGRLLDIPTYHTQPQCCRNASPGPTMRHRQENKKKRFIWTNLLAASCIRVPHLGHIEVASKDGIVQPKALNC